MSIAHITIYGIPNCDAVKKARAWFASSDIAFEFHDLKKQGVPPQALARWLNAVGWTTLLNRRGTTWRNLAPSAQAAVSDEESARHLMIDQPSVIKRPVVELNRAGAVHVTVGYSPEKWMSWHRDHA
jgi:Spx/MgsR family transcriptional regulator